MTDYYDFIKGKQLADVPTGFDADIPVGPLFDFQAACVKWALKRGRAALFLDTGLGKTLCQVTWADRVCEHTGGNVIIAAPLCVSQQTVEEAAKFGITVKYCRTDDEVEPGITITNYEMLEHFDLDSFVGVVLDECFAKGTKVNVVVDGKVTTKHIEDIQIGDRIINASGVDTVADIHRREVQYAIKVHVKDSYFIASPNHPIFTQRGWVGAQDLRSGDYALEAGKAMSLVRDGIFSKISGAERPEVLRDILLSEMAHEPARAFGEGAQLSGRGEERVEAFSVVELGESKSECRDGKNTIAESDVSSGNKRQGEPHIERDEARTFRSWRKQQGNDCATSVLDGTVAARMDSGVCLVTGETESRLSNALQDGLVKSRDDDLHRGGWQLALREKGSRQEKDGDAGIFRVEGIEVLEQGHHELEDLRDEDGSLYFYDIGATRHPSFSVNGLLVHNSSILKAHTSKTRAYITEQFRATPYKLSCTATPSPNDFMELGNQSEFLGVMNAQEMLATFFTHDGGDTGKWRLKGHGKVKFWEWMASWAICIRNPSDLGFDGSRYELPPINIVEHVVSGGELVEGQLFAITAQTLTERRQAKKSSMDDRIELAAKIANSIDGPVIVWCHMNEESERLAKLVKDGVEVTGSMSLEEKSKNIMAFSHEERRAIITKASIAGYGLNWQHCNTMIFAGMDDSFEKYYQAVRRCHRFGQKKQVTVHIITAETEGAVKANIERKQAQANEMAAKMIDRMRQITKAQIVGARSNTETYNPTLPMTIPAWLKEAA